MVKMEPLLRGDPYTLGLLDYAPQMHPIGAQLCGSNPKLAGPAARIIEELGFDVVDLNCGCPVDKVTGDGSGSGMLRHPELIGEVISQMVAVVKIPVTVKIRIGWDASSINAEEVAQIAEAAGAQLIAVHGRTRAQGYKGVADREMIKRVKAATKSIKVAGNGDVFDPASAVHMFNHTGCDAILISRGTMGGPWLAADILTVLEGRAVPLRTPLEGLETLLLHFERIEQYREGRRVLVDMRRVGPWYCREMAGVSDLRKSLAETQCSKEARRKVVEFAAAHATRAS
jgi:tRNA-dihydrouridine synthase B